MEVESLIKISWAIETDGALRVKPSTKLIDLLCLYWLLPPAAFEADDGASILSRYADTLQGSQNTCAIPKKFARALLRTARRLAGGRSSPLR